MSEPTSDPKPDTERGPTPETIPDDPASPALRAEIDRNFDVFKARLPRLLLRHRGRHALMHHGEIVQFFDTARDAIVAGNLLFTEDGLFSVQEVEESPADLGWYSRVVPLT